MAGDVSADAAMALASDIVSGESGEDTTEKEDGKLSLRMKLVTPVEEGNSERFSLQSKNFTSNSNLEHVNPLSTDRMVAMEMPYAFVTRLSNTFLFTRANTTRGGWICRQGYHCF